MLGLNRLWNLLANFAAFVMLSYGLYSIINSIALYACSGAPPVGFIAILCLLAPLFKFLFVRFRLKDEKTPRAIIDMNISPINLTTREDKRGDV